MSLGASENGKQSIGEECDQEETDSSRHEDERYNGISNVIVFLDVWNEYTRGYFELTSSLPTLSSR